MSQLTNIPLQDNYKSTLSQAWDGNTGTIYVNTVPSFTFPAGVKTYICVDAGKTTMQVARISAYDATLKTITVDSITVDKGNGVSYTAQAHTVGSVIEISDNYQFRDDIKTAINTKVDTNVQGTFIGTYANAIARDAAITSPVNGKYSVYMQDSNTWVDYINGSWITRSTQSNASTTAKGVVEKATSGEITAGTATGGTGAELFVGPAELKTVTDGLTTSINAKPNIATNTEAQTGTGTTQAINPYQLRNFAGPTPIAGTTFNAFATVSSIATNSTSYIKKSEATVTRDGTYRITFTGSSNADFWYIRVYKNGVPYGTERGGIGAGVQYTEDLSFVAGDLLQLYMKNAAGGGAVSTCTNYSVTYNNYIMTNTTF